MTNVFLGHLLRDDLINPVKMSVPTYVRTSRIKHNAATTHTHTHTQPFYCSYGICPGPPGWAGTRKVKTNLDLLEQETVSGSGICWAICKSAPHPRQPHQHPTTQFFTGRMPFLTPNQQRQSTEGNNAATNKMVHLFVKVDKTFTTMWLSRSSEVRVKLKVTWDLKFQQWRFSTSISSAISQPIKKIPTVSDTRPKYLKSLVPDFLISS